MIYTIEEGDTLRKIANKLTLDESYWQAIAEYNGIESLSERPVGTALAIPDSWLKTTTTSNISRPTPKIFGVPANWVMGAGAAMLVYLILSGK